MCDAAPPVPSRVDPDWAQRLAQMVRAAEIARQQHMARLWHFVEEPDDADL